MAGVFGEIEPPDAISGGYGLIDGSGGGLITFVSNIVVLATVLAGIWALFNILAAGFSLINASGDSSKVGEMSEKITNSFIGLLVMVAAPLIAALIGLFLTGDASFFLQPEIFGPGSF